MNDNHQPILVPKELPANWLGREPYCHMSAELSRWLLDRLRPSVLPANAMIVGQDRRPSRVGIVIGGQVALVVQGRGRRRACFSLIKSGQFFGFTALLCQGVSPYGVRSLSPVVCWELARRYFLRFIDKDISVREFFYREAMARTEHAYRKTRGIELPPGHNVRCERPVSASIEKALAFLDTRYMDPISLDDVAAFCGMSKYCFSRRFNAETGCSLKAYLNRIRVMAAKEMLQQEDVNISEACFAVGFNELSYFSRVFRRIEGQSPSAYLKRL